jgi:hypothetical protein
LAAALVALIAGPESALANPEVLCGLKVSYPLAWSTTTNLAPYARLYGDYYFSRDDANTIGLTTVPLLQGWSAHAIGGLAAKFGGGAQLGAGGEFGGIGGSTHIWTWRARGSVPF